MASKHFDINNLGKVTVTKSRRSKNMRLTIKHDGSTLVSIPNWMPYKIGLEYAQSKREWIVSHRSEPVSLLENTRIGKAHRLHFIPTQCSRCSSRIIEDRINIYHPTALNPEEADVQKIAKEACVRALTMQAESLLLNRLAIIAARHGFKYSNVRVRTLRSRWGSCSSRGEIVLNCYLMQLPWNEIDYVLLHELTHTKHMSHNGQFWNTLTEHMPKAKELRKQLATRKPHVFVL